MRMKVWAGYLPKRPSPYPNPKKHARQFRCRKNELHTTRVRQSNTVKREGVREGVRQGGTEIGERKRGEGGMERTILSTERKTG